MQQLQSSAAAKSAKDFDKLLVCGHACRLPAIGVSGTRLTCSLMPQGQLTSSVDELSRALEQSKEATKVSLVLVWLPDHSLEQAASLTLAHGAQAGQLEFEEWKKDMAKRRSESLFFKSLYRDKQGKPKRLVDKLDVFAYPEVSCIRL